MFRLSSPLIFILLSIFAVKAAMAADQRKPQSQPQWRTLAAENTLYMDTGHGRVVFELAQSFNPNHVAHIKKLVRSGFYDGLTFYRVIDRFVVQGGDLKGKSDKSVKAEFERDIAVKTPFTLVQSPDLLAQQTGFSDGFAVGRSVQENKEWLLSCPGIINLARGNDPHSGTTDFAIMIGQATRHLDRNMSIFGRIVYGMAHLNLIKRGQTSKGGMIEDPQLRSKIVKMSIGADLPKDQRLNISIENTNSEAFKQKLSDKRSRSSDFFVHKGNGALDICYINVAVRVSSATESPAD